MADATTDFASAIFAKTPIGQQEIQSRSLGLSPMARRLLVLIDGRRTGQDLAPFVAGHDLSQCLNELLGHACVDVAVAPAVAPTAPAANPASAASAASAADGAAAPGPLAGLPPAESRSAKDLDMARNFMTNTVNNIFGHHNRISLIESIHGCQTTEQLRGVYPAWASALETSTMGNKRLPELREKLFVVL